MAKKVLALSRQLPGVCMVHMQAAWMIYIVFQNCCFTAAAAGYAGQARCHC